MTKLNHKFLDVKKRYDRVVHDVNQIVISTHVDEHGNIVTTAEISGEDSILPPALIKSDQLPIVLAAIGWLSNPKCKLNMFIADDHDEMTFAGLEASVYKIDYTE